jgi:hypothetical protein
MNFEPMAQGMKRYTHIFVIIILLMASCSKEKSSEVKENLILDYMTAGSWVLDLFTSSTINILPEFNGYTFQFNRNGTVTASKGTMVVTGTWYGNQDDRSVTASFPQGSGPLLRLNATWYLFNTTLNSVQARAISNQFFYSIRLVRRP